MAKAKKEPQADQAKKSKESEWVAAMVVVVVALAVVVTVVSFWPAGAAWIQNLILLATAAVVVRYTHETARLREETRNMVEEAKRSREQAEAAGVVDAEIRLHERICNAITWCDRDYVYLECEPKLAKAMFDAGAPAKDLLGSNGDEAEAAPKKDTDAAISIEKLLRAIDDSHVTPGQFAKAEPEILLETWGARREAKQALADCEFLIRLCNGRCRNTARVAAQHLPTYDFLQDLFLKFIAFQRLFTRTPDYGETYLAYFLKIGVGPQKTMRAILRARKSNGEPPTDTGNNDAATK